jgi:acyl-CoA synthetase (AMP-forming)/AMP-acid ligase II
MAALPGVGFTQAYGMTELSPLATVNPAYYHTAEGRKLGKLRAAGRAGYCIDLRIVDPRRQRGAARHGRRGRGARPERDAGLLEQARADGRGRAQRLDAHRRRRPGWTTTASSSSPTG